jgi:cytochrome b pre-mRNA-processing protein 3
MIMSLFRKNTATAPVYAVYAAIVAQSRQQRFYAEWGVPDTVTGRFDMISLHLALLFRRLRSESSEVRRFSQAVFDLFFKDMDRSLREMGVGDLGVPKRVQKMGGLFYGMLASLNEALDKGDRTEIEAVLTRNVFGGESPAALALFADYVEAEAARIDAQHVNTIVAGTLALGAAA